MTPDDATEVLTLQGAGQRFGVSPELLRGMARRGELARAHKRPCPAGEEWVVPVLTVEALVASGSVGSAEVAPDGLERLRPQPAPTGPRRGRRGRGGLVAGLLVLLVLAVGAGALAVAGGDDDRPAEEASPTTAADIGARVTAVLDDELAPGAPVGVAGRAALALVGEGRVVVELPAAGAVPEVIVVAGAIAPAAQPVVAAIRDQGTLILTLSGSATPAEVWRVPPGFQAPAPAPAEAEPPAVAPVNDPPAAPAGPTEPSPAPGSTVVVAAGQGFWQVAEEVLAGSSGHAPSDAEVTTYWAQLIEANRDVLPDPGDVDLLYAGMTLELPAP